MKTKRKPAKTMASIAESEETSLCASGPHAVHPILKTYFGYCFSKAALKYKAQLSKELEGHGITSPQLGILKLLHVLGPVSFRVRVAGAVLPYAVIRPA